MDRLGFTYCQDHVHKLPYNQPNAVSVYVAWKALDTFARRHGVKSFLVKGSVFETEVIKAWLGALDLQPYPVRRGLCPNTNPPPMNPIPDYGITATGETTAIVPAHRRKPEELQPFATAVARNMPGMTTVEITASDQRWSACTMPPITPRKAQITAPSLRRV